MKWWIYIVNFKAKSMHVSGWGPDSCNYNAPLNLKMTGKILYMPLRMITPYRNVYWECNGLNHKWIHQNTQSSNKTVI